VTYAASYVRSALDTSQDELLPVLWTRS